MAAKKPKPPVDVILAANSYAVKGSRSVRGKWWLDDIRIISLPLAGDDIEPELQVKAIFVHASALSSWWWNIDKVAARLLEQAAP